MRLGERLGHLVASLFGRSTLGLGYSILLVDGVIAPAFPSNTARSGVLHPLALSVAEAAVAAGPKGVVIARVGNGNMTKPALDVLATQAKQGIVCVRSSRVATGRVGRKVEVDDDALVS